MSARREDDDMDFGPVRGAAIALLVMVAVVALAIALLVRGALMQTCLFCGGDASEPNHRARCDGRQGAREAAEFVFDGRAFGYPPDWPRCVTCGEPALDGHLTCGRVACDEARAREDVPMLISGLTPDTHGTSAAAAVAVLNSKDTQREAVYDAIRAAGAHGRTDDELQALLGLDGSSERPRRWELWKLDRICICRDAEGAAVRRLTRTHRTAVVWVACEKEAR